MIPGLFRDWRDALAATGWLGCLWAVGLLVTYIAAEVLCDAILWWLR
jgi:hypothetical protein